MVIKHVSTDAIVVRTECPVLVILLAILFRVAVMLGAIIMVALAIRFAMVTKHVCTGAIVLAIIMAKHANVIRRVMDMSHVRATIRVTGIHAHAMAGATRILLAHATAQDILYALAIRHVMAIPRARAIIRVTDLYVRAMQLVTKKDLVQMLYRSNCSSGRQILKWVEVLASNAEVLTEDL